MLRKVMIVMLGIVLSCVLTSSLFAYTAQDKLMAKRAAKLDGYRMLLERVKGLQIDSETFIADMVTESDEIAAKFEHFINGAEMTDSRFDETNGISEVTMEMNLRKIIDELQVIQKHYKMGNKYKVRWMGRYTQDKIIKVKGYGAVAGSSGQRRLMSRRAAIIDAYRNLSETIEGLKIDSTTYVRDFIAESDEIRSEMHNFLKGARIVSTTWGSDNACTVRIDITIRQLIAKLENLHRHRHFGHKDYQFEKVSVYTKDKVVSAVGEGLPTDEMDYDEFFGTGISTQEGEKEIIINEGVVVE